MRRLPEVLIEPVVRLALAEDLGRAGDMTAMACIPEDARMKAAFAARKPGVLAGIDCVRLAVLAMDPKASVDLRLRDGDAFEAGAVLAVVEADARAFLGRADGAQSGRTAQRRGDLDAHPCPNRRRDQGADRGYAQDHARAARA